MPSTTTLRSNSTGPLIESLEPRQLLTVATTTTIVASAKTAEFGTAITLVAEVKASKGTAVPTGTVELLSGGKDTGYNGELNSKGQFTFSYTAGNALFTGKFSFSARYLGSAHFAAGKSKVAAVDVTVPTYTTASNGLKTAVVKAGKGTATVQAGDVIVNAGTEYTSTGMYVADTASHGNGLETLNLDTVLQQDEPGFFDALIGTKVGETIDIEVPVALAGNSGGNSDVFVVQIKSIVS